jgi:hypothetical protein
MVAARAYTSAIGADDDSASGIAARTWINRIIGSETLMVRLW